jgi:hypothetical protein
MLAPYLNCASNQQLAAPIVLVGPVVELHTTIPVEKNLPYTPKSKEKFQKVNKRGYKDYRRRNLNVKKLKRQY